MLSEYWVEEDALRYEAMTPGGPVTGRIAVGRAGYG